jgi:putative NADH-flavin reductase
MKLTVFGATGGTGRQLIRQALTAGHRVTAIARHPEAITITHPEPAILPGDVLNPSWPGAGMDGADAVLSALGARPMRPPTTTYSRGTAAVIAAMTTAGIGRLVTVSAAPLVPDSCKSLLERRVVHPLLYRFFGGGYEDMRQMERLLAESPIDWTVFRPARLTNGPKTSHYRTAIGRPLGHAWSISRANLAEAMLAAVNDPATYHRAVTIAK